MSPGVIITPQAWIPIFLTVPSIFNARWKTWPAKSVPRAICLISFTRLMSSELFFNFSWSSMSDNLNILFKEISGINFARRSASKSGKFSTRAVSRTEDFAAMVPYVMICATWFAPYFLITQSITLLRPSSSKSISISGIDTRSGFKKRSKSRSYLIGSMFVIPVQ